MWIAIFLDWIMLAKGLCLKKKLPYGIFKIVINNKF
jgi:hypothetical protein